MKTPSIAKIAREGSAPIELAFLIPFVILLGVILFYTCHLGIRRLKDESDIRQNVWMDRGSVSLANHHPYQVNASNLLEDTAEKRRIGSMDGLTQTGYSGLRRLRFMPALDYNSHTAVISGTWDAARTRRQDLERGWEKKIGGGILGVNIHPKMAGLFLKPGSGSQLSQLSILGNQLGVRILLAFSRFHGNQQQAERADNNLDRKKLEAEKRLTETKNRKRLLEQKLQKLIPGSPEWIQVKNEILEVDQKIHQLEKAFDQGNW